MKMSMELELGGVFANNSTYDYDLDYEYKDDSESKDTALVSIPVLYSMVVIVGLLVNGLLLFVLAQKRRSWSISDTFMLNLIVADILLLLVTLPLWTAQAAQHCEWCFKDFFCKISGAVFNINFYCGIFLLVLICLDCYLSIVHSIQFYSSERPRLAHISCLLVWISSLILCVPDYIFLVAGKDPEEKSVCVHKYSLSPTDWQLLSRLLHHLLGFMLPAAALICCSSGVLLRLRHSPTDLQKKRYIMVILPLVVVFLLCWTPYNITLIVDTVRRSSEKLNDGLFTVSSLETPLIVTSALGCTHAFLRPLLCLFLAMRRRATDDSSLWEMGVGEKVLPDQRPVEEELKELNVEHQKQSSQ
uniref:Chemokine (C-X-C motif) receptor 3, tandem duplicate 3 n=1 Tax=Dicentrarchus labrax TaxID=13489 RepID=A0A8P4K639_DICLA